MDYLTSLIQLNESLKHKAALITQQRTFTYAELIAAAMSIRCRADFARGYVFIHAENIAQQLCRFIAYSGTSIVPVIATKTSQMQQFAVHYIPQNACMGVMTSGSSGKSKLLWRSYESWANFFPQQNKVFGMDKDTVIFCQGSLAFTGNLNIYLGVLSVGGTIVAADAFAPKRWLTMLEKYAVNAIYMIPSKLMLLARAAKRQNDGIKHIISGSQSMGRQGALRLQQIFPRAEITLYYGASELNYISYIKDAEMTDDETLIGRPFDDVHIEIKDDEITVDTPYAIEDIELPFSLRDKGFIDADGMLHFCGRKDDILNVNGIKVSAYKVEAALKKYLSVSEAAVLALKNGDSDMLLAFVSGAENFLNRADILKKLRQNLTEYEIPKKFIQLPELPKNESGKMDKLALAKLCDENSFA